MFDIRLYPYLAFNFTLALGTPSSNAKIISFCNALVISGLLLPSLLAWIAQIDCGVPVQFVGSDATNV